MKVLIVSDIHTHPHNRGNLQGLYRECVQMKKLGWEIDFLYWGNRIVPDFDSMYDFFGEEHIFFANTSNIALKHQIRVYIRTCMDYRKITRYISVPYDIDERYHKEVEEKVLFLDQKNHYDIVWIEYYLQSKIFCNLRKDIIKVIHTHDRFGKRNRIFQRIGRIPEFYYLTEKGERKALSRADVVIAVQDAERRYFSRLLEKTDTKCLAIGNQVEMKATKYVEENSYGFLGAMNDSNELALEWFIQNVLPEIRKKEPDSTFYIEGGVCKSVPDSNEYIKLGVVSTVEEFYNKVKFVISPMKNGTGLNIKNIEALSYQKPLVTTNIGAKGLDDAQKAMCICDRADVFSESVTSLLNDKNKCELMREEAKKFIESYSDNNKSTLKEIENLAIERKRQMR